jgi:ankyrin repeat protein
VVKTLLDKGADVNAVTNKSETVIHHVLQNWDQQSKIFGRDNTDEKKIDMKVIELLVQNGFDVNAKTSDGTSVLHWTSEKGHVGIVNLLIANGADVKAVTASGETVLHYAARGRSTDLVEMFAEVGIDARDINGTSALHVAAQYGRHSVVISLLHCSPRH